MSIKETLTCNCDPHRVLIVKGQSMYPFLRTGDILLTESVEVKELKVGDILVLEFGGKGDYLVHRLLKMNKDNSGLKIKTKGDNNILYDGAVTEKELIAKGIKIIRGNKTLDLNIQ